MQPDTRYAKSGDVHIAYQVFGEGPINLVLALPFVSNVEDKRCAGIMARPNKAKDQEENI